jgi:hypothetical protein
MSVIKHRASKLRHMAARDTYKVASSNTQYIVVSIFYAQPVVDNGASNCSPKLRLDEPLTPLEKYAVKLGT